jgi:hypothetical protein
MQTPEKSGPTVACGPQPEAKLVLAIEEMYHSQMNRLQPVAFYPAVQGVA